MELPMWSRKRPLFNGPEKEPPLSAKRRLAGVETLLDRYHGATHDATLKTCCGHCCVNGGPRQLTDTVKSFSEQVSSWEDTQYSVNKVLGHLKLKQANDDALLSDPVNEKFLGFHRDFTEECGAEDKQHSWAVIEKREEVVMYGPYYPNYNNGEHSEDIVIKQTEELLQPEALSEDWKVYVFTVNSPCLARNTHPCMLNLVQKAREWWSAYGVKTHIGYVKCWGFKGAKENLFRDINHSQVDCIDQAEEHESYVRAAEKSTDLNPVCENLFSAVKHLLTSASFPLTNAVHGQDWRSCFRSMHSIFESKPEDEKEMFTQEANAVVGAAKALLSEKSESYEEYLEKGRALASDHTFSSQVPDDLWDQARLAFRRRWQEMVRDKRVEFIRETLTEEFNRCTVQLFIKDAVKFTGEYLQIGRIQFPEEDLKAPQGVRYTNSEP